MPVHHDDLGRRRRRPRDRERARRGDAVAAGAHRRRCSASGGRRLGRGAHASGSASSANEPIGPYTLRRLARGGLEPGAPGPVLHARGARAACCRARSASASRPRASSAFLVDPIGPGTRAIAALDAGRRDPRARAARQRLRPRRRAAAARRRRHRHRAVPVPLRAARRAAGAARLPDARTTPRRRRSSRTPRSCSTRRSSPRRFPDDPGDVLACGPEPMLDALARLVPGAQLAWEAPMACGYGACYGCVVRVDGRYRRLCIDGPVLARDGRPRMSVAVPILNASGCLDALAAPDVARTLDAFVTKTITPLPREGNPPVRIAETEHGMLNSIGLQGPGIDAFVERPPAAARGARRARSGSRSAASRPTTTRSCCARLDARRRRRDDRAEPLVPERRGGARDGGGARRRGPRPRRRSRSTRSSRRRSGTSPTSAARGRRRRAPTGSRSSTRSAGSRSTRRRCGRGSRAGVGGYSGPALRPIALACVYACAAAVDVPIVGMGGVCVGARRARARRGRRERGRARHGALRRPGCARRGSGASWRPRRRPRVDRIRTRCSRDLLSI